MAFVYKQRASFLGAGQYKRLGQAGESAEYTVSAGDLAVNLEGHEAPLQTSE